jgi:hypothetical protein
MSMKPTEAGPEALSLLEAPGRTESGIVICGAEGRVVLMCRGRGVQLGPIGADDMRALGQQILDAAHERETAERRIAGRASAALRRVIN